MREHTQTFDLVAAVALVDKHMSGCPAMKRFLELIAAHYPNTPMPRVERPWQRAHRSVRRLCFVPPGRPLYGVLVHFDNEDTRRCFVIELNNGNGSGRACSEEHAVAQLERFL